MKTYRTYTYTHTYTHARALVPFIYESGRELPSESLCLKEFWLSLLFMELREGGAKDAWVENQCAGASTIIPTRLPACLTFPLLSPQLFASHSCICTHMAIHTESMSGQLPRNHHPRVWKGESVGRRKAQHGEVEGCETSWREHRPERFVFSVILILHLKKPPKKHHINVQAQSPKLN